MTSKSRLQTFGSLAAIFLCGFCRIFAANINPFESALGFNAFVSGNFTNANNNISGPAAMGGNLNFGNLGGVKIADDSAGTYVAPGDILPSGLVVGGRVDFANSAGTLDIGTPNLAGIVKIGSPPFIVWPGGNARTRINNRRFSDGIPRIEVNADQSSNSVAQASGIDFSGSFSQMRAYSTQMSLLTPTATGASLGLKGPNTTLTNFALAAGLNVINVTGQQWQNLVRIRWDNARLPSIARTVIFNIDAQGASPFNFGDLDINLDVSLSPFVIYHVYNLAGRIDFTGRRDVIGSIMAPTADLNATKPKLNGQMVSVNYFSEADIGYLPNLVTFEQPPFIDLNGPAAGEDITSNFFEQTPIAIAPGATVAKETGLVASLTAKLNTRPDGNSIESLSLNAAGASAASGAGLTVTYTASTGVLLVSGSGTTNVYQQVLRGVVYNNTSDNPNRASRTVTVEARNGGPSIARTATVMVHEINDPPAAVADVGSNIQGDSGPRTIPFSVLLANDTVGPASEIGQVLTIISVTSGVGGSAVISGTNVIFTPDPNFNGTATFTYTIQDNGTTAGTNDFKTATATVSATVTEENDPPVATANTLTPVAEDSGPRIIPFSVLLSDDTPGPPNESGQTLTIISVGSPVGGSVLISGTDVIFTTTADFNGTASFTYTIRDNGTTAGTNDFQTASAPVSFLVTEVNDPPTAQNDTLTGVEENSASRSIPFAELLANDSVGPANESGQVLTVVSVGNAVGGTAVIVGNTVVFTLATGFDGTARFDYTARDNGTSGGISDFKTASATVSFSVSEVNYAPIAGNDVLSRVGEDSGPRTIPFAALLANDSPGPADESGQTLTIIAVTNAVGGSVSIVGTNIIFTLATNFNGIAEFGYIVQDNGTTAGQDSFQTAQALVTFEVFEVNDPPITRDDILSPVIGDSPARIIPWGDLLANDQPGPNNDTGETLKIIGLANVVGGTAVISGFDIIFTLAPDFNGTAKFDYIAQDDGTTDGTNDFKSASATVTFQVTEVNDPPVAVNDILSSVAEDSGVRTIPVSVLLGNDSPGSGEASTQVLTVTGAGSGVGGSVSLSGANILFTPATNFNGEASFIYTIRDNGTTAGTNDFKTASATVVFSITPVNDPPIAFSQNVGVDEDGVASFTLRGDDGDPEIAQLLTFAITVPPAHGTISDFNAVTGKYTYTPAPNYTGPDAIQFTVTDDASAGPPANLTSAPATVTIDVSSAPDIPSVTPTTTHEGTLSASGLIITPHLSEADVTHFKIDRIENGALFQRDGITPVADGGVITAAQGTAGLRFLPTAGLYNPGSVFSFIVQAALDSSGNQVGPGAVASITVEPNLDFGDAPDPPYPTLLASDGARHVVLKSGATVYLGTAPPDTETDGQPSSDATGDNKAGSDDEEGVVFSGRIGRGQTYSVTVKATGSSGRLSAWIDWNRDGNWNGAGEQILTNEALADEIKTFVLTAPLTVSSGQSFARFRFSTDTDLRPTGMASDGEVADYAVELFVNSAPVASPATYTLAQGGALNANDVDGTATPGNSNDNGVLTHVSDAESDPLTFSLAAAPSFASSFALNPDGTFTYAHDDSRNFSDSFVYTVSDGQGGTNSGTVNFSITEVNHAPVAMNEDTDVTANVIEDAPSVLIPFQEILINDSPGQGEEHQTLTVISVSNPVGGTVSLGANGVNFVLTPDFNGVASFTYTIQDNGTTSGTNDFKTSNATVSFKVVEANDPPIVVDPPASTLAGDTTLSIPVSTLLVNATPGPPNESGQTLSLSLRSSVGGTAVIVGENVVFTPNPDYIGPAGFGFAVTDNGTTAGVLDPRTANGFVSLTITEVNDPPIAVNDILSDIPEDSGPRTIPISVLLANDSAGPLNESGQTLTLTANNATGGTVTMSGTDVIFTPAPDYNGPAGFSYTIQDNGTTDGVADPKSATALVSFTITEVNDRPVAVNDILSPINEGSGPRTIPFGDLLVNDLRGPANESEQTLTIIAVGNAIGGTASIAGSTVVFTPLADFYGTASFEYTVQDNGTTGGVNDFKTATATVIFQMTEINDPPIAGNDALDRIPEDFVLTIPQSALLANDLPGPPNEFDQTLTLVAVTNAVGGSVAIVGTDIIFTPTPNYNGAAQFAYTIRDNGTTAGTNAFTTTQAVVTFSIFEVNDPPQAGTDTLSSISQNSGPVAIPLSVLLANDTAGPANESGQTITITDVFDGDGGIVAIVGTNVVFTPFNSFSGPASFTYELRDNGTTDGAPDSRTSIGTVSFFISEFNSPPVAVDDTLSSVAEDSGPRTIPFAVLLVNDRNGTVVELDQTLTIISVGSPVGGTAIISGTNVIFTPAANFSGGASFGYTIEDNGTTSGTNDFKTASATVTFTITEVNAPPTLDAINNSPAISEDAGLQTISLSGISAGGGETQTLIVTASSGNVSLIPNPTVNYTSPNATGSLSYTSVANASGTAQITVTVNDGGASNNITTRTFTVTVNPLNDPPTLDPIAIPGPKNENEGTQTVNLTGISAGGGEAQTITVTAVSDNPGLVPNPTVHYTSPAPTGSLTYTPEPNTNGTARISVTVNDGGASNNIVTRTFEVIILGQPVAPAVGEVIVDLNGMEAGTDVIVNFPVTKSVLIATNAVMDANLNLPWFFAFAEARLSPRPDGAGESLILPPIGGIDPPVVTYNPATGVLTIDALIRGASDYQAWLRQVYYTNSSANPNPTDRKITVFAYSTNIFTGASNVSSAVTSTVVFPRPPVIAAGNTASYTEQAAAVAVSPLLTVTDSDNANLQGASVWISGGLVTGDNLSFTNHNGITGNYNSGNGNSDAEWFLQCGQLSNSLAECCLLLHQRQSHRIRGQRNAHDFLHCQRWKPHKRSCEQHDHYYSGQRPTSHYRRQHRQLYRAGSGDGYFSPLGRD